MALKYTEEFAEAYNALPDDALPSVNNLLDQLEDGHASPEMRNVIRLGGGRSVYATPRVDAGGVDYRITWMNDEGATGLAVLCITLADATIRRAP